MNKNELLYFSTCVSYVTRHRHTHIQDFFFFIFDRFFDENIYRFFDVVNIRLCCALKANF